MTKICQTPTLQLVFTAEDRMCCVAQLDIVFVGTIS